MTKYPPLWIQDVEKLFSINTLAGGKNNYLKQAGDPFHKILKVGPTSDVYCMIPLVKVHSKCEVCIITIFKTGVD